MNGMITNCIINEDNYAVTLERRNLIANKEGDAELNQLRSNRLIAMMIMMMMIVMISAEFTWVEIHNHDDDDIDDDVN